MVTSEQHPAGSQAVDRALSILEILARRGESSVGAVAVELGVHKSTASRLLAALERHGLVVQSEWRGTYQLGFGLIRLAGATTAHSSVSRELQSICDTLAQSLNDTVNVAILDELACINVVQAMGRASVAAVKEYVGRRTPLHATSSGKVLLAYAPPEIREKVLSLPLGAFTDRTIGSPSVLRAALDQVLDQGWATNDEEWERDTSAVAVPVRSLRGDVVAALSVTGPSTRINPPRFADIASRLQAGAATMSAHVEFLASLR